MKTTQGLIALFSKGNIHFKISDKQAKWLFNLAEKEGNISGGNPAYIYHGTNVYRISPCMIPFSAYGGGIGRKRGSGYMVGLYHYIKFNDTGIVSFCDHHQLPNKDEYDYTIIEKPNNEIVEDLFLVD